MTGSLIPDDALIRQSAEPHETTSMTNAPAEPRRIRHAGAHPMNRFRILFCTALFASVAVLGSAQAQPSIHDPIGAEALFRRGLAALKAGDWGLACSKFQASVDLEPAVSTWVKVAKCHEHDGKLASAWYDYQRASKLNHELEQTAKRREELDDHIRKAVASLEPRVPKLSISVEPRPEGLQIYRDGVLLAPSALNEELPVDPGEHEVTARALNYREQRQIVNAAEGAVVHCNLVLTLEPAAETTNPAPLPPVTPAIPQVAPVAAPEAQSSHQASLRNPPPETQSGWHQRHSAFVLGGAGIVGLGIAAYFGIHTLSLVSDSNSHCPLYCDGEGKSLRDRATRSQNYGFLAAGLGAATLGIGVTLYVTAPAAKDAGHPGTQVESTLTPNGVVLRGAW